LAGNERETKNSKCHDPQSDKKFPRHCYHRTLMAPIITTREQPMPVCCSFGGAIGLEKIMTRSALIGLAAAFLVAGATMAMAQNGPPTGGYPPARWNPNLYGHYGYSPRYQGYYPVYPTVAGYWDYYRTSWPGRGNDLESTR
jgi:hypothetical protein